MYSLFKFALLKSEHEVPNFCIKCISDYSGIFVLFTLKIIHPLLDAVYITCGLLLSTPLQCDLMLSLISSKLCHRIALFLVCKEVIILS